MRLRRIIIFHIFDRVIYILFKLCRFCHDLTIFACREILNRDVVSNRFLKVRDRIYIVTLPDPGYIKQLFIQFFVKNFSFDRGGVFIEIVEEPDIRLFRKV